MHSDNGDVYIHWFGKSEEKFNCINSLEKCITYGSPILPFAFQRKSKLITNKVF